MQWISSITLTTNWYWLTINNYGNKISALASTSDIWTWIQKIFHIYAKMRKLVCIRFQEFLISKMVDKDILKISRDSNKSVRKVLGLCFFYWELNRILIESYSFGLKYCSVMLQTLVTYKFQHLIINYIKVKLNLVWILMRYGFVKGFIFYHALCELPNFQDSFQCVSESIDNKVSFSCVNQ